MEISHAVCFISRRPLTDRVITPEGTVCGGQSYNIIGNLLSWRMARKSTQKIWVTPTSGGYAPFVGHARSHGYSSTRSSKEMATLGLANCKLLYLS